MNSDDLMDVYYWNGPEQLVEFRKRSEMGRRRQKDVCLCCERSIGCFPGWPCFNMVCTCLAQTLLLALENEVLWAAVVGRRDRKLTANNFGTSWFFLWKGLFNATLIGSYWQLGYLNSFQSWKKIFPTSGWRDDPGYLKWCRKRV